MAKIGRNDPCPCGSGKKHKRCCVAGSSAERERAIDPIEPQPHVCDFCGTEAGDEFNDRADHILDVLMKGHIDDAEALCLEFIQDFPGEAEGIDLLSMVYEDRGERQRALELLRQASSIAHARPDYDNETRLLMRQRIKELELAA